MKTFLTPTLSLFPLQEEARRMHEVMCTAAVVIFPLFAFFDVYTIPATHYWSLTILRLTISASIAIWLGLQRKFSTNPLYLSIYSFAAISWFCCLACVFGGKEFLYQHNVAYCTVFLGASLFLLWDWRLSLLVVFSSVIIYSALASYMADFDFRDFCMEGGTTLLTIMALHPLVAFFRFRTLKKEYSLKAQLRESYHQLLLGKEEVEQRNNELLSAREKLNAANQQLREVNQHLEELVHARTVSLESTNGDLQEALHELDMFFYSSFHDLKGPVARVKGLSLLGLEDAKDETSKTYSDLMLRTAIEMETMLEKFNKINMLSQIRPESAKINLSEFITNMINELVPPPFTVRMIISPLLKLLSDARLLRIIIENILDNSIIYREEDRPLVIEIKGMEVGNDLQLVIWDNGSGIRASMLEKVFQMFFRGSDKSVGHGLGLYLVKKAVEKLNGVVDIKSLEGEYTQVRIILPNVIH